MSVGKNQHFLFNAIFDCKTYFVYFIQNESSLYNYEQIVNKQKTIDNPGFICYTLIRKRKGDRNNVSNQNDNRKDNRIFASFRK